MRIKSVLTTLLCTVSTINFAQENFRVELLKTKDGKPIEVGTSHAAPCIYDFNHDGLNDLLVGEFGDQPVDPTDKKSHAYVRSKLRIYVNKGTNEAPSYDNFSYLQADGADAYVPVTCCISFQPRFIDLNCDGIDDIISGSYPGDIYFFKGKGEQTFAKGEVIYKMDSIHSICPEPIDWDNNGVTDLFVSYRSGNPWLIMNKGTVNAPEWEKAREIPIARCEYIYEPLNQSRKNWPLHAFPKDWDNDGLFDLVCGDENGNLFWYKNHGKLGSPAFDKPTLMYDNQDSQRTSDNMIPIGSRVKVFPIDYNRDGKLDIVAGDFYCYTKTVKTLTPKEEFSKAKLENQLKIYQDEFTKILDARKDFISNIPKEKLPLKGKNYTSEIDKILPKELVKNYHKYNKKCNKIWDKLDKLRDYEYISSGYVWVFYKNN